MDLSPHQLAFLRFFASGPPHAVTWRDADRRTLGPVLDPAQPPAEAVAVLVYRLEDGNGLTFKGAARDRAELALPALAGLAPCWAIPLRTLNDLGLSEASRPVPPPLVGINFKGTQALDAALKRCAATEGRSVSDILRDLAAAYVEGRAAKSGDPMK